MKGWEVQYSEDKEEVCVIPRPSISCYDFHMLLEHFKKKGYKLWMPSDERCGYRFSKENVKTNDH